MPLGQCASTAVCFLRSVKSNLCHTSYVSNQLKTLSKVLFAQSIQGDESNIPSGKMFATLSLVLLYAVMPSPCAVPETKLILALL